MICICGIGMIGCKTSYYLPFPYWVNSTDSIREGDTDGKMFAKRVIDHVYKLDFDFEQQEYFKVCRDTLFDYLLGGGIFHFSSHSHINFLMNILKIDTLVIVEQFGGRSDFYYCTFCFYPSKWRESYESGRFTVIGDYRRRLWISADKSFSRTCDIRPYRDWLTARDEFIVNALRKKGCLKEIYRTSARYKCYPDKRLVITYVTRNGSKYEIQSILLNYFLADYLDRESIENPKYEVD